MRTSPKTIVLIAMAGLAGVAVLKNHQRRAAPTTAPPQTAELVEDAWSEALSDEFATPESGPAQPLDPFVLSDLQFVIEKVRGLIKEGRDRCEKLGEPGYEPGLGGAREKEHVAAWHSFSAEWNAELDDAASYLPSAPDWDAYPEASLAYQDIGRAIQELRLVPIGAGEWATPFESLWSSRFETAAQLLDAAAVRLDPAAGSRP